MRAGTPSADLGLVHGLSLVAFTVVVLVVFVAFEVGWRPSGAGSGALIAVNEVRDAAKAMVAQRSTPLQDVADGSLAALEQRRLLRPLTDGKLPIKGGGSIVRVQWIGVKNRLQAFVAITLDASSREALEDVFARAGRQRAFVREPVRGLACNSRPPPGQTTRATLCYALPVPSP